MAWIFMPAVFFRIGESICQVDGDSQGLEEPVRCDQSLDGSDSKTRTDGNLGNRVA